VNCPWVRNDIDKDFVVKWLDNNLMLAVGGSSILTLVLLLNDYDCNVCLTICLYMFGFLFIQLVSHVGV
jgi:hypothetical protein